MAKVAKKINLADCIIVGRSHAPEKARLRDSLLADALEAVMAAVYLDSDFPTAAKVVCKLFKSELDTDPEPMMQMDAKSVLQELLQEKFKQTPSY